MKSIYDLKLLEILPVEQDGKELFTSSMRVPGGWIFRSYHRGYKMMSAVFVPFDNEFQTEPKAPPSEKEPGK